MDHSYRSSLVRRLRTVHGLYFEAVDSMELHHVNHVERDGVLPIAFSLVHQVLVEDSSRFFAGGPLPLFNDEWSARIGLTLPTDGKEEPVAVMMAQRIGDYHAFREFQVEVFTTTEAFVDSLEPGHFDDILAVAPYPDVLANTFSARLGGSAGITRADAIESWIYQHALRHLGEIEHARALVDLGGLTS